MKDFDKGKVTRSCKLSPQSHFQHKVSMDPQKELSSQKRISRSSAELAGFPQCGIIPWSASQKALLSVHTLIIHTCIDHSLSCIFWIAFAFICSSQVLLFSACIPMVLELCLGHSTDVSMSLQLVLSWAFYGSHRGDNSIFWLDFRTFWKFS